MLRIKIALYFDVVALPECGGVNGGVEREHHSGLYNNPDNNVFNILLF